jgi:hypothetical protein
VKQFSRVEFNACLRSTAETYKEWNETVGPVSERVLLALAADRGLIVGDLRKAVGSALPHAIRTFASRINMRLEPNTIEEAGKVAVEDVTAETEAWEYYESQFIKTT